MVILYLNTSELISSRIAKSLSVVIVLLLNVIILHSLIPWSVVTIIRRSLLILIDFIHAIPFIIVFILVLLLLVFIHRNLLMMA